MHREPRACMTAARIALLAIAAIAFSALASSAAGPQRLALPVACDMARNCSIQNYVDADPGPAYADYRCGALTYNGHKGTDFQLPDLAAMRRGVAVLAAADGIVRNTRDGVPDLGAAEWRRTGNDTNALGNAVAIRHADGTETLYGHLRRGSVRVAPGERVAVGQSLGLIGLSGDTEFPHLHFQVMRDGRPIDPFTGAEAGTAACGAATTPLWTRTAGAELAYRAATLLCGAFAFGVPDRAQIRDTCPVPTAATPDASALVLFAELAGVRQGDRLLFVIHRPDGSALLDERIAVEQTQARRFQYVGRRQPDGGWPPGRYVGRLALDRAGTLVIDTERVLEVR